MNKSIAIAVLCLGIGIGGSASATTISFTGAATQGGGAYAEAGLEFDDLRVIPTSGNCTSMSGPLCGALNKNETGILTKTGGGTFSLSSIWYDVQGAKTFLSLTAGAFTLNLGNATTSTYIDLSVYSQFQDVSSVTFTANQGNVRFDDIGIATAPVPVPAAGLMLLAGLGALAATKRRKAA